jgi:hypothetical protein
MRFCGHGGTEVTLIDRVDDSWTCGKPQITSQGEGVQERAISCSVFPVKVDYLAEFISRVTRSLGAGIARPNGSSAINSDRCLNYSDANEMSAVRWLLFDV